MTLQEAVVLYRTEREKREDNLPPLWTAIKRSRKTQYPLGDGAYLTHIEPAE